MGQSVNMTLRPLMLFVVGLFSFGPHSTKAFRDSCDMSYVKSVAHAWRLVRRTQCTTENVSLSAPRVLRFLSPRTLTRRSFNFPQMSEPRFQLTSRSDMEKSIETVRSLRSSASASTKERAVVSLPSAFACSALSRALTFSRSCHRKPRILPSAHIHTSLHSLPEKTACHGTIITKRVVGYTVDIPKRIENSLSGLIRNVRRDFLFAPTRRTPILQCTRSACPTQATSCCTVAKRFDICGRRTIAFVSYTGLADVTLTTHAAAAPLLLLRQPHLQRVTASVCRVRRFTSITASFTGACALPDRRARLKRRIMNPIGEVCRKMILFSGMAKSSLGSSLFAINQVASS